MFAFHTHREAKNPIVAFRFLVEIGDELAIKLSRANHSTKESERIPHNMLWLISLSNYVCMYA